MPCFFSTLPFSFLSFILFNLILYFCFYSPTSACGHTDETPRWEGKARRRNASAPLLFLFLLVAHVCGPPSGGGRATEAHLQTQLPFKQMFARTHTCTHGHTHAYTAVKSKPIMSHLFLTSSQSDQVDRRPGGGGSASLWPFSHTCSGTQTLLNLGSCRFFLPPTLILLPCLLTPSIFIIPLFPPFF